jgi:NitT/TauT family transport system ATP-binding protein
MFQFFSESKKTALLITHDIETAVALADRVLLFAPRPTTIIETYTVGLARKTGSTSAAREHADFQPIFQTILNAYANHGQ